MPPDRGRASKACTACHRQKTRCYSAKNRGGPCMRCDRLQQTCSLESPHVRRAEGFDDERNASSEDRIGKLERMMQIVVERLDTIAPSVESSTAAAEWPSSRAQNNTNMLAAPISRLAIPNSTISQLDTQQSLAVDSAAPVYAIRDVAAEVGPPRQAHRALDGSSSDIIDLGFINKQDASSLVSLFLQHYGRWVAFKETGSADSIFREVRTSPLLLCACCLIAVRHTTEDYAARLAPRLFQEAKSLLSAALLVVPQTIAFFQATIILSLWSTTIGEALLSIDSWLISRFALQHCFTSDMFDSIINPKQSSPLTPQEIDKCSIWNHLCLVHLQYCVGTRRKALLNQEQIQRSRRILDSHHATNFETRMVAELNLYWIIYERCSTATVDLPGTQALLNSWKQEWSFLFDQPRPQFLQMGFHFAQLLMYEKAIKSRSAAVRESLLSEMVRLSAAILSLAMDTADVRTQHLSDQIYHTITFAALTLCRLLHMYEEQLARTHDIAELDLLILNFVTWLHSIGLPCHVAHTLGDVVSAFHQKLRPNARPTPTYVEPDLWEQDNFLNFPDQFGSELLHPWNGTFLPDWGPFIQGPPT